MTLENQSKILRFFPDLGDLFFVFILYFLLYLLPHFLFGDGSTGWHLVTGNYILSHHEIPHHDLFSYTFPHAPWVPYEWLSDLIMACLIKCGGIALLQVVIVSGYALLAFLLYEQCRLRNCPFLLSVIIVWCGQIASSVHWLARPHIFTYFGLLIYLSCLEKFHRREIKPQTLLLVIFLTTLVWVNCHPAFGVGLACIAIYALCELLLAVVHKSEEIRQSCRHKFFWLTGVALAALIGSFCNPVGPSLYVYLKNYLTNTTVLAETNEYMSPFSSAHTGLQTTYFEVMLALFVISLVCSKRRPSIPQFLVCLATTHLSLLSVRNVPLFVIAATPLIAEMFAHLSLNDLLIATPTSWIRKAVNYCIRFSNNIAYNEAQAQLHLLPIVLVVVLIFVYPHGLHSRNTVKAFYGFSPDSFPTQTLSCIQKYQLNPQCGFSLDNWGGYLNYTLGIPVFIDDRADFYGQKFYLQYAQILGVAPGWSQTLTKNKIQWVLFPKDSSLVTALKEDPHWKLLCTDKAACLLAKVTKSATTSDTK